MVGRTEIVARIRRVVGEYGRLALPVDTISDDADLYQSGLSSHATVNVMLALEVEFDVEFPDSKLTRPAFGSIAAISDTVEALLSP